VVEQVPMKLVEGVTASIEGDEFYLDRLFNLTNTLWDLRDNVASLEVRFDGLGMRSVGNLTTAVLSLGLAAAALTGTIDYSCDLIDPPEDIKGRPHAVGGDMIFQCFHNPHHCWDNHWNAISCP
jgi:hypothetical protein